MTELVYISWGGTGRAATLRSALAEASAADKGLLYLAILDDSTFSDIDETTLALAADELAWLLDAQVELTKSQVGVDDVPVRVLVRAGDVADEAAEVVKTVGETELLIGAPVPLAGHGSVNDLIEHLRSRVSVPVRLVEPNDDEVAGVS